MALYDSAVYQQALDELDDKTQRVDAAPTKQQRLSRLTIVSLICNRTIGSGILVAQKYILSGTGGSVGTSLILWGIGGLAAICGSFVWLEFGLSTPRHTINGERKGVPRSGGEKNYLEYFYKKPELLATCIFGVSFVALGNLSGNAYAFGRYIVSAAGKDPEDKGPVIGAAMASLTAVVLIHTCTRKGGILLNHVLALFKILFLLAIIVLGIVKSTRTGMELSSYDSNVNENFDSAFKSSNSTATGVAEALFYVLYSYSGFEQPFYVLTEFSAPRKRFTKYVIGTVIFVTVLFIGVNTAFLLVVPRDYQTNPPPGIQSDDDIGLVFFTMVFGNDHAKRAMSALAAVSILGNLVVMTFTASRVKQEIAKEGILPFSLFWSTSKDSPGAMLATWWRRNVLRKPDPYNGQDNPETHREKIPVAALFLHWLSSVVLVAITAFLSPETAYLILVNLYTYVNVVLMGFFTAFGLLLLKLRTKWRWSQKSHFGGINKWIGLIPALFYTLFCAFLLILPFVPPPDNMPKRYPFWLIPSVGMSFLLWGTLWWLALRLYMRFTHQRLSVTRQTYVKQDPHDDDSYLQVAEIVSHEWQSSIGSEDSDSDHWNLEGIDHQRPKGTAMLHFT